MNEEVEGLRAENERLRVDVEELTAENEALQGQLDELNQRGAQLPDLLEIRDRILKEWKLSRTSEKKARLWEFGERLIRAIEAALPDPDYTHLQRMRSELDQLRKSQAASVKGAIEWEERYREAQRRLDQRR